MLSIPDKLVFNTQPVEYVLRHAEDGIDGLDGGLAQEGEAEQRVEGVRHVPGPVSKPARLRVLKQMLVDAVHSAENCSEAGWCVYPGGKRPISREAIRK
jgi:hypothetical protein